LTGGKSQRMGQDKATLTLRDGMDQTQRGKALLSSICDEVFISVAAGNPPTSDTLPDILENTGPLAGLHAAFQKNPKANWLVLACDLPLIESDVLQMITDAHEGGATAYKNRMDQRAEPLCAVYSPGSAEPLTQWLAKGKFCARHFLESLSPTLLDLPDKHLYALDNANTPEDLIELENRLSDSATEKTLSLLHFAQLRDQVGASETSHTTTCATAAGVYDEMRMIHSLSLQRKHLKVAINGDFADWSTRISDGDELVFIPPVSGG